MRANRLLFLRESFSDGINGELMEQEGSETKEYFSELPDEIIQKIFMFLKPNVLFLMLRVSKRYFNNVAELIVKEDYWNKGLGAACLKAEIDIQTL